MGSTASQPKWNARYAGFAHEPQRVSRSAGITIAHAGRQIRFGPVAFWIAVGTVVIMAGWSVATATYFAFRDDVLKELMARQAEQQYAYEDRIAELRARIDRTTSRQLLDQEQFEQKLDDLLRRQSTLESRATAIGGLSDPGVTGAFRPNGRNSQDFFGERAVQPRPTLRPRSRFDCYRPQEWQRGRHRREACACRLLTRSR